MTERTELANLYEDEDDDSLSGSDLDAIVTKFIDYNPDGPVGSSTFSKRSCVHRSGVFNATSQPRDLEAAEQNLFTNAREFLTLSKPFQFTMHVFAKRKLLVFFGIHAVVTLIIWMHFSLIKYDQQFNSISEDSNRFKMKLVIPTISFGSKHAILFQMAMLPLSMSRFSIAALSGSFVDRLIPLNRALKIHIHLGYTMASMTALATALFFVYFGTLCVDGEEYFCKQLKSEIMISAYAIMGILGLIVGTSFFRYHIRYEFFYAIHQLVFLMYFITIAHTLDNEYRTGRKNRSQTFIWFSSSLVLYFCDRIAMNSYHRYSSRLVEASTVTGSHGARMIILKINRPTLLSFEPGQYAYLRIKNVDSEWHPFSIASGPESAVLEFYVEVFDGGTWTEKLWNVLEDNCAREMAYGFDLEVEVMGPYGTGLRTTEASHVLALGSGTGIVPMLSLLQKHVGQMLHLEPNYFFHELHERTMKLHRIQRIRETHKGSLVKKMYRYFFGKPVQEKTLRSQTRKSIARNTIKKSIAEMATLNSSKHGNSSSAFVQETERLFQESKSTMRKEAKRTIRSLYGIAALSISPILGVSVIALTISWNTISLKDGLFAGMSETLRALTYTFQIIFFAVSLFVWDASTIWSNLDLAFCIAAPLANVYFHFSYENHGTLPGSQIAWACILNGYMTVRLWFRVVQPRHQSWKAYIKNGGGFDSLERLELVWTSRSASQVSRLLPELLRMWKPLVSAWDYDNAMEVCRISIHVTDPDKAACEILRSEMEETPFELSFSRVDIQKWIDDHALDMIETKKQSSTVLAFCGSPVLAGAIQKHKIANDMLRAITGHKEHQMEFESESYGGIKPSSKGKKQKTSIPPEKQEEVVESSDLHKEESGSSQVDNEDRRKRRPTLQRGLSQRSAVNVCSENMGYKTSDTFMSSVDMWALQKDDAEEEESSGMPNLRRRSGLTRSLSRQSSSIRGFDPNALGLNTESENTVKETRRSTGLKRGLSRRSSSIKGFGAEGFSKKVEFALHDSTATMDL